MPFIIEPAWIDVACTLPISRLHVLLIIYAAFFLVLILLLLVLILFRALLRTRCKSERASKHVSEPVPRLQNELFLALQMLRCREYRKDSLLLFREYIWKAWKLIQAKILTIVSCYVNNAFFTIHEIICIVQLIFSNIIQRSFPCIHYDFYL